jgi:hypothetical protein
MIMKVFLLLTFALGVSRADKLRGVRPAEQTDRRIQGCSKNNFKLAGEEGTRPGGSAGGVGGTYWCS